MPKNAMFVPMDLSKPGALDELKRIHSGLFGGWRMADEGGASGEAGDGTGGDAGGDAGAGSGGPGSDGGKPIAEMTADEKLAYFEKKANRLQGVLRGMGDYEQVKTELTALKQSAMSDQEKAVQKAKDEGRTEAAREWSAKIAGERIRGKLSASMSDDKLDELLDPLDLSKFLDAQGQVDTDKVNKYVATFGASNQPDMGQGRRPAGSTKKGEEGRSEAERRFGKKS